MILTLVGTYEAIESILKNFSKSVDFVLTILFSLTSQVSKGELELR